MELNLWQVAKFGVEDLKRFWTTPAWLAYLSFIGSVAMACLVRGRPKHAERQRYQGRSSHATLTEPCPTMSPSPPHQAVHHMYEESVKAGVARPRDEIVRPGTFALSSALAGSMCVVQVLYPLPWPAPCASCRCCACAVRGAELLRSFHCQPHRQP